MVPSHDQWDIRLLVVRLFGLAGMAAEKLVSTAAGGHSDVRTFIGHCDPPCRMGLSSLISDHIGRRVPAY